MFSLSSYSVNCMEMNNQVSFLHNILYRIPRLWKLSHALTLTRQGGDAPLMFFTNSEKSAKFAIIYGAPLMHIL